MFEILKALMALDEACRADRKRLSWQVVQPESDTASTIHIEIPIWDADVEFIEQMQALLAPVED